MSKVVLNDWNITPKESSILLALAVITKYQTEFGVTAQGIANVLSGRVGGSPSATRKGLKVLKEMGMVDYFQIGKTKCWHLTENGGAYVASMRDKALWGNYYQKPAVMFNEIPF